MIHCQPSIKISFKVKKLGEKRKLGSKWAKDWLLKRNSLSQINLKELKLEPGDWYSYLRIDSEAYSELLQKVMLRVRKFDSVIRRVITARERCGVTLRFLATGRSCKDLKFSAAISPQAFGVIIPETCAAMYEVLKKDHLKVS